MFVKNNAKAIIKKTERRLQKSQLRQQAEQRAERLAMQLRALGINPDEFGD